jgi:hypothetical protein
VPAAVAAAAARGAALVVVHGTAPGTAAVARLASHALWRWTTGRSPAVPGDWYAAPGVTASPVGAALAGVPADSLPPLAGVAALAPRADSARWTALAARLARRGPAWPVIVGEDSAGRRLVRTVGWGLWRWASQGGVAAEAYRSLVGALTDWLLAPAAEASPSLAAGRDTLNRGLDELLPRPATLHAQAGAPVTAGGESVPLRNAPAVYALALGALMLEWMARRRRGMR